MNERGLFSKPNLDVPYKRIMPKACARMSVRHQRILALFLRGMSPGEIARTLGMSAQTVNIVIRNPSTAVMLEQLSAACDRELTALYPQAVDAVRRGLTDKDPDVALRAAKAYFAIVGKSAEARDKQGVTAEDVVARLFEIEADGPVRVTLREAKLGSGVISRLADREEPI